MPTTTQDSKARSPRPVAIVTGAAHRIGRAIAESLAADGYAVAVHYNTSADKAGEVVDGIVGRGGEAIAVGADMTDVPAVVGIVDRTVEAFGPPTCLVNNASLFRYDSIRTISVESWDAHMNANARGPLFLTKAFAEATVAGPDNVVVNLLDQKLWNMNPDFLSYTASKIALEGLTTALAMALAPRIRVVGVAPGLTLRSGKQTDESFAEAHSQTPLKRGSTLEDILSAVRFAIANRAVTGHTILVDGGQHLGRRPRDVAFDI